MLAGTKFIAGLAVGGRLTGGLMQHDAINPPAEGVVGVRFQFGRAKRPMGAVTLLLGKGFGLGLAQPIHMRPCGGLFKIKLQSRVGIEIIGRIIPHPELARGKVAAP